MHHKNACFHQPAATRAPSYTTRQEVGSYECAEANETYVSHKIWDLRDFFECAHFHGDDDTKVYIHCMVQVRFLSK